MPEGRGVLPLLNNPDEVRDPGLRDIVSPIPGFCSRVEESVVRMSVELVITPKSTGLFDLCSAGASVRSA